MQSQSSLERERFETILTTLTPYRDLFLERRCLDYGASWGTSMSALLTLGAAQVCGIEPDAARVVQGQAMLRTTPGYVGLLHLSDTTHLPFADGTFDFVLVNAVLEHIPRPRAAHLREIWRMVAPGGIVLINETPNLYFPIEKHTTGLWGNHWLPCMLAYRRAVRAGRFDGRRTDWQSSGWRGLGYWEMVHELSGYRLIPESSKPRHRMLTQCGLPASLFDPYPTWVLQKP